MRTNLGRQGRGQLCSGRESQCQLSDRMHHAPFALTFAPMSAAKPTKQSLSLVKQLEHHAHASDLRAFLEALPASERTREVMSLRGGAVRKLYDLFATERVLTSAEVVPGGSSEVMIYEGRNSLALFSRFQKRLIRIGDRIVGYNHQSMSLFTGPGYFVVKEADRALPHRGEVLFDYECDPLVPPFGWPRFRRNDTGLGVFKELKDYVRQVAFGVFVGKAYRGNIDLNAYFALCRV